MACENAARTPPRSSAASPRAVGAAGRGHGAAQGQRVVLPRAQQRGGAGHRLRDERRGDVAASCRGGSPRRPAPRRAAPSRPGRRRWRRRRRASAPPGTSTTVPDAAEELEHLGVELRVDRRSGRGEGEHALADLDRGVRLHPEDRRARVGLAQLRLRRRARAARRRAARAPAISSRDARASCAGLWARMTTSARSASSRLEATASPPTSAASSFARPGARVRAEHRLAPAERERPRHVAAADEADHGGDSSFAAIL